MTHIIYNNEQVKFTVWNPQQDRLVTTQFRFFLMGQCQRLIWWSDLAMPFGYELIVHLIPCLLPVGQTLTVCGFTVFWVSDGCLWVDLNLAHYPCSFACTRPWKGILKSCKNVENEWYQNCVTLERDYEGNGQETRDWENVVEPGDACWEKHFNLDCKLRWWHSAEVMIVTKMRSIQDILRRRPMPGMSKSARNATVMMLNQIEIHPPTWFWIILNKIVEKWNKKRLKSCTPLLPQQGSRCPWPAPWRSAWRRRSSCSPSAAGCRRTPGFQL